MIYRRFYIPFFLVLPIIIIISCSLCFAQYTTYNPALNYQTNPLGYPNYQNTTYSGYQASSYWPNPTGSYLDPYSQTIPYNVGLRNYASSGLTNPYNPYGTVSPYGYSPLNTGNPFYNYNPLVYSYTSQLYNPLGSFGFPLNLAGAYNPQISPTNTTTYGTTSSDGTSGTNGANYTTYSGYQASSYWPNPTGSYLDPYSQTIPYNVGLGNYVSSGLTNPYNPYGTVSPYGYSPLNTGNSFYNYDPLGYSYISQLYNPLGSFGFPLNLAGAYNPQTNTTPYGTTSSDGTSGTNGVNYTTQASSFYPSIFPGITAPFQIDPYALSALTLSSLYLNPLSSYLPNQNYYQNPYVSYPYNYNIGQATTVNPYQSPFAYNTNPYTSNPTNPYNQQSPYTQPLPYYQTNSNTASSEANLVNVNGTWTGTWFTTLSDGTVNNGDVTLSLTQNGIELYGNISFSINSYQKLNTNLNGTINGSSLTLTGILISGAEFYTLSVNGNISGTNLSGTYSINTNSGSIIESGTYNIAHL